MKKERQNLKQIQNFYLDIIEGNSEALKKSMNNYSKMNHIESIIKNDGSQTEKQTKLSKRFESILN